MRVLREYALEPLRAELRVSGSRVLEVRGGVAAAQLAPCSTCFDGAWVELDSLAGIDLVALAQDLARALPPGGRLVCVVAGGASLLARALAPFVEWRRRRALGALLPGGSEWPRRHPLAFALLAAADHVLGSRWPWRVLGGWAVLEGVRR